MLSYLKPKVRKTFRGATVQSLKVITSLHEANWSASSSRSSEMLLSLCSLRRSWTSSKPKARRPPKF